MGLMRVEPVTIARHYAAPLNHGSRFFHPCFREIRGHSTLQGKTPMHDFLRITDVIDWSDPEIYDLACSLAIENDALKTASGCFHWVRDRIAHSFDSNAQCVSCSASETLRNRTGICYAKSHLLAALLRANRIPAAFGYQRLALDDAGTKFCLHGFNFVHLDHLGWYAVDPRGNREGIITQFDPPKVSLAFSANWARRRWTQSLQIRSVASWRACRQVKL